MESGLKLNLNQLARQRLIRPGAYTGPVGIAWTNSYTGEQIGADRRSRGVARRFRPRWRRRASVWAFPLL